MTWQDDCRSSGGAPTVFPYDVPLTQIFPELPAITSFATVAGWPACRTSDGAGGYTYSMTSMSLSEKLALLQSIAGDVYAQDVAGPIASAGLAVASAASDVTTGIKYIGVLGLALAFLLLLHRER